MDSSRIESLLESVRELQARALHQESALQADIDRLHPRHVRGGRNLAHYLALRQHDLRDLQRDLARLGLSSLGRLERCAVSTLVAVERALCALGSCAAPMQPSAPPTDFETGPALLASNAAELLGPAPKARATRVMATLPLDSSAALIDDLVEQGADIVRLNCSKGGIQEWQRLIERVRAAERRQGRTCRILCDLAGPNPRTMALRPHHAERGLLGRVSPGDCFVLAKDRRSVERIADRAKHHRTLTVGCTLPSILDDLRVGERVYYDDGKVSGIVRRVAEGAAEVEVSATLKDRAKVRHDKGLNFPDSKLRLPSLTAKDVHDLEFIARNADMVGLSFVRHPSDVEALREHLRGPNAEELGIVLKVETMDAFAELPRLLLTAMQSSRVGVMVARGDMAVELGYARLAEAQEEILWMCEAALIPVIWATQVLENLTKTGVPSRAEVTDAAMGARAECVMLNQGKHLVDSVRFLSGVLTRMQEHQEKKRSLLRRLSISKVVHTPNSPATPLDSQPP